MTFWQFADNHAVLLSIVTVVVAIVIADCFPSTQMETKTTWKDAVALGAEVNQESLAKFGLEALRYLRCQEELKRLLADHEVLVKDRHDSFFFNDPPLAARIEKHMIAMQEVSKSNDLAYGGMLALARAFGLLDD